MKTPTYIPGCHRGGANSQRGVVLFFALIALVVMSLAAVALIRSVDTSTLIAGNLAFKQSATTSADGGIETAINALTTAQANMTSSNNMATIDPGCPTNCSNVLNTTSPGNGYYSSLTDPNLTANLTDTANWSNNTSMLVGNDQAGNEVRYIIQRMCQTANMMPNLTQDTANNKTACLFSAPQLDNGGHQVPLPSTVCVGNGCPSAGQAPEYRITSRSAGPGNTFSYVQVFVY
jgi:type IV pilus assembly protein PilX